MTTILEELEGLDFIISQRNRFHKKFIDNDIVIWPVEFFRKNITAIGLSKILKIIHFRMEEKYFWRAKN